MADKVKDALKAAASFKARGIKKAALDVVAEYEAKKQAAPGDEPIQRDQPAAQADPAIPDPTVQPAAPAAPPVAPVEEVEEEEAEETPEAKAARVREAIEIELGDDDLVTAVIEFLEAEKLDYDDYSVDVTDNSDGTATVAGYIIAPNDDVPENMALAQVRSDLESEPELFNQDWLQGHINEERLRNDLSSDVENMALESVRESPDSYGWDADDVYETDAEGNYIDAEGNMVDDPDTPSDEWIESKAEEIAASQLRDPVAYMQEIYGDADGIKQAIELAGIDINAAAEEAVAADGWQHFLSRYDGNSYDLPSGGVYWKE